MKRLVFTLLTMLVIQSTQALIVSVNDEGEVPEEGMNLTVTQGEEDILSGKYTMKLEGEVLTTSGELTVQIIRSKAGLTDEFCCGNNCTAGNGELEETRTFQFSGVAHWYVHYEPVVGSDETIRYIFRDGSESREINVQYVPQIDAVTTTTSVAPKARKIVRDGQICIMHDGQLFDLTGRRIDEK